MWKETPKLLMNDKKEPEQHTFSIEISLNNVSTLNTKRWSGVMWELNLTATPRGMTFLSVLSS